MSRKVCIFVLGNMDYTAHYNSSFGGITLASDGKALTGLWFDGQRYFGSTLDMSSPAIGSTQGYSPTVFDDTRRWLDIYFSGHEPDFMPPLSLKGTSFQQHVLKALLTIPYGQTVTYGELARRLGCRSAQAVGGAVGRNPISIIVPCHRVVGAARANHDSPLRGYAAGLDRKRTLLRLEQT